MGRFSFGSVVGLMLIVAGITIMAIASAAQAQNHEYYLVTQWVGDYGQRFCKYSNGTVLNVGVRVCPTSIKGW